MCNVYLVQNIISAYLIVNLLMFFLFGAGFFFFTRVRWENSVGTHFKDCNCQTSNSCGKMLNIFGFLSHHVKIAKQQVPAFICHLFRRQQKIPIWLTEPRLHWFPKYAMLQLHDFLSDLVLTGLLFLAASNKHLLELKKLCYASQRSIHALKQFKVINNPICSVIS